MGRKNGLQVGQAVRQPSSDSEAAREGANIVVALVGAGIQHSRTPQMHMQEGARLGLSYDYRLIDTDADTAGAHSDIGAIVASARASGICGLNITFPFKQAVLPHLDALSDNARRIGAVNTVVFGPDGATGHNTDMPGFSEGFRRNLDGAPLNHVALIGAGGAGAAVARSLMRLGTRHLYVLDIDATRARELVADLAEDFGDAAIEAVDADDLRRLALDGLVNATPVGMETCPGLPVEPDLLKPTMWVSDIIYIPLETELLRAARQRGCRVMDGADMAVFQAARAFELFTGLVPDTARMRETFDAL